MGLVEQDWVNLVKKAHDEFVQVSSLDSGSLDTLSFCLLGLRNTTGTGRHEQ